MACGHLEAEPRSVKWTETYRAKVNIGGFTCDCCDAPTPSPTEAEVVAFCKENPSSNFMWANGDERDGWRPTGWTKTGAEYLCPDCTKAKTDALAARRKAKDDGLLRRG